MLVLVVNNSLTPLLRNDLQLEGTRPCDYYALISSSPVPLPTKRRQFVAAPMDSPGGSPPRRGWETLDDDSLGEIARRSDVLTAARLGASCTNFFKTLLKQVWEKAMLVGLPCVLEEKVLLWDNPLNSLKEHAVPPCLVLVIDDNLYGLMVSLSCIWRVCP